MGQRARRECGVPEVSTMVVVTALLLLTSGGMVITGTTVWIFEMNVSLTKDVTNLVKG
jgi:hypothetical protein